MRCQCGKPNAIITKVDPHAPSIAVGMIEVLPTDIHFKKATDICEKCGIPICFNCSEVRFIDDDYGVICDKKFYCYTCNELAKSGDITLE